MKFLIQTINGEIVYDFAFTLLEALRYHKWMGRDYHMSMITGGGVDEPGWIPVGSVEFVQDYLKDAYGYTVKPRNVPEELMPVQFSGRTIRNTNISRCYNIAPLGLHIKSNDKIKLEIDLANVEPGSYQTSLIQDYISEWRAFVWREELVGLQNTHKHP